MLTEAKAHEKALADNKPYTPFCLFGGNKSTYDGSNLIKKMESVFEEYWPCEKCAVMFKDSSGILKPITKIFVSKGATIPSAEGFGGIHIWFDTGWE